MICSRVLGRFPNAFVSSVLVLFAAISGAQTLDIKTIIQKSVAATNHDYEEHSEYDYKERDKLSDGTKTYQITMIEGTPYERLIAINGKPLPGPQAAEEQRKQQQVAAERKAESMAQRQQRIAKYQRDRNRDHEMMSQLTEAFDFRLIGVRKLRGLNVYVLRATPRPRYNPPSIDSQGLTRNAGRNVD